MSKTAADALVDCFLAWQVDVVFGLPGDAINGVMAGKIVRNIALEKFRELV